MLDHTTTWAGAVQTETEQIAGGLRRRDVALLHDLVEQYQYRLVRYLIYVLGRRDHVDDLVQETWIRVVERGSSYNGHSPFQAWLFTIARNLAIDHLRKKKNISLDSSEDSESEKSAPSDFLVSTAPSPFELAARTEDAAKLAKSMATLQPIYREALLLRFQESFSLEEISKTVGAPVATVSSRIHRGLAMLKIHLEGGSHAN
jgi:RNA polymerase sigma-70 factor (ECF subfamily)